jgi:hypothetical protein
MRGRSKPLSHEDEEDDDDVFVPCTAPAATQRPAHLPRAPVAAPATAPPAFVQRSGGTGEHRARTSTTAAPAASVSPAPAMHAQGLMQAQMEAVQLHMQIQAAAADRQMEMMMKMNQDTMALAVALLSKRQQREAAAPPLSDPLEAVRLGMEIAKAQQAVAMPAQEPHPLERLQTTIALMKDMRVLAPPVPRGAPSDMADFQAEIDKLVGGLKAGAAPKTAVNAEGSRQPAVVVIDGRFLTIDAAAAEYARLMGGQVVDDSAPVATEPLAPPAPPVGASSQDGAVVTTETAGDTAFAAGLAELIARSLRAASGGAEAPKDPPSGGEPPRADSAADSSGDKPVVSEVRETIVAVPDEPRVAARDADHAPMEQPAREEPEQARSIESPAPPTAPEDQMAIDDFLRGAPVALAWLRAAVEVEGLVPLPEPPADLGYFAEAVEVIRKHPAGRAMLRAVVERAVHGSDDGASPRVASDREHGAIPGSTAIQADDPSRPGGPEPPGAARAA